MGGHGKFGKKYVKAKRINEGACTTLNVNKIIIKILGGKLIDQTQFNLKGLNGGEFQQLMSKLLPRIDIKYKGLVNSGAVEGTAKTRKGTPDIWKKKGLDFLICIEITVDEKKTKLLEDLKVRDILEPFINIYILSPYLSRYVLCLYNIQDFSKCLDLSKRIREIHGEFTEFIRYEAIINILLVRVKKQHFGILFLMGKERKRDSQI